MPAALNDVICWNSLLNDGRTINSRVNAAAHDGIKGHETNLRDGRRDVYMKNAINEEKATDGISVGDCGRMATMVTLFVFSFAGNHLCPWLSRTVTPHQPVVPVFR